MDGCTGAAGAWRRMGPQNSRFFFDGQFNSTSLRQPAPISGKFTVRSVHLPLGVTKRINPQYVPFRFAIHGVHKFESQSPPTLGYVVLCPYFFLPLTVWKCAKLHFFKFPLSPHRHTTRNIDNIVISLSFTTLPLVSSHRHRLHNTGLHSSCINRPIPPMPLKVAPKGRRRHLLRLGKAGNRPRTIKAKR